jgi:hypothetical protein
MVKTISTALSITFYRHFHLTYGSIPHLWLSIRRKDIFQLSHPPMKHQSIKESPNEPKLVEICCFFLLTKLTK